MSLNTGDDGSISNHFCKPPVELSARHW